MVDFDDKAMLWSCKGQDKTLYSSVIIDESQDLTPAQLRALISLVRQKENNVLILSDQQIYQLNSWRKDMHVDIVGNPFILTLTTGLLSRLRNMPMNSLCTQQKRLPQELQKHIIPRANGV